MLFAQIVKWVTRFPMIQNQIDQKQVMYAQDARLK